MSFNMKIILCCLAILLFCSSACQKIVEGCMHPRAQNYNPEADEDEGCVFYELQLNMNHFADSLANDTLTFGDYLYDTDDTSFYLSSFSVLCSGVHLFDFSGSEYSGAEQIKLYDLSGNALYAEDNFFIVSPGTYSYNISAWTQLGSFDSMCFYVGVTPEINKINPARVSENNHPLSLSSVPYMFDSTSTCLSLQMGIVLPGTGNVQSFNFYDYFPVHLPYAVSVVDGSNTAIRLKLDYQILFNDISFTNDNDSVVKSKILQNIPHAFSTY